jgi:hypothetical protein
MPTIAVVDGIDLKHFVPGQKYDVGTALGALMLAEGWAEPIEDGEVMIVPFSDADPFMSRVIDRSTPPNLIRETYPPYADAMTTAADFERRKRRRPPRVTRR